MIIRHLSVSKDLLAAEAGVAGSRIRCHLTQIVVRTMRTFISVAAAYDKIANFTFMHRFFCTEYASSLLSIYVKCRLFIDWTTALFNQYVLQFSIVIFIPNFYDFKMPKYTPMLLVRT